MHCWAGTIAEAERTLALGFYLGFGGVITFKNAEENRQIAAAVPLNRLLLETDDHLDVLIRSSHDDLEVEDYLRDVVEIETSTPKAKAFIDALSATPFFFTALVKNSRKPTP